MMTTATESGIVCFTDLKGSTTMTEVMGNAAFMAHLHEHLATGRTLAERIGGVYIKNIGDAHLVKFHSIEDALAYAVQMQQCCQSGRCYKDAGFEIRIGLSQGAIVPDGDSDIFGAGVNQAARVQSLAQPGQVLINAALRQTAAAALGTAGEKYFVSTGHHELKGILNPLTQELFSFEWKQYAIDYHESTLAKVVFQHLGGAEVELNNFNLGDLSQPGTVIWPVVPRNLATAIHRGQIEVIRLLALLGWNIKVLVADCGDERTHDIAEVKQFAERLSRHMTKRNIINMDIMLLSEMYEPEREDYVAIQKLFRTITSQMSVQDLLAINAKEYSEEVIKEIRDRPTLTYLRPPLTIAAVLHVAKTVNQKCAVISGKDEALQWKHAYNITGAMDRIGALMIPIVKMDPSHQLYQKDRWPIWDSFQEIGTTIKEDSNNVGWWLFRLHAFLPAFPAPFVAIGGEKIFPESWAVGVKLPEVIDATALAEHVWPLLDPH